ncbi:MAG: flagellar biosynthetic protein FliR [Pirellulales bacterium]
MQAMPQLPEIGQHELIVFVLALVRIGALVAVAPVFGAAAVPWRLRGGLAVALALLVTTVEAGRITSLPDSAAGLLVVAGGEALVGLVLGLGVALLFSALQVAGQIISQMSGMQLAEVLDPQLGGQTPVVSQLLFYLTLAVFLSIGGHRQVLEALLDSFATLPAGQGAQPTTVAAAMTSVLANSFVLGVRAAAPAMVALLVATLVLGLIGRALPQLNAFAFGFGFHAAVMFLALALSLGATAWLLQDELGPALETVIAALTPQ